MKIIICLDMNNGIRFNKRRQSKDREVIYDILRNYGDSKIWMTSYSKEMFDESIMLLEDKEESQNLLALIERNVMVDEECLDKADKMDYCFIESDIVNKYTDEIKEVIVYRWDKIYPQDERFDIEVDRINNIKELKGYSHDIISRETYL